MGGAKISFHELPVTNIKKLKFPDIPCIMAWDTKALGAKVQDTKALAAKVQDIKALGAKVQDTKARSTRWPHFRTLCRQ